MSAVIDNSAPSATNDQAASVTTGVPMPIKPNRNALFKILTRSFAFLAAIVVSLVYGSHESLSTTVYLFCGVTIGTR
jgi:hypothetical protein